MPTIRGYRPEDLPGATIRLYLPYPPTLNTYWRHVAVRGRVRVLVSERGRAYRQDVLAAVLTQGRPTIAGRLAVRMYVRCPDRRARDLDNLPKCVLDSLASAGVYADDAQIDRLEIERQGVESPGGLLVLIEPMKGQGGTPAP